MTKTPDGLSPDKELVGALDSACNRTCAGPEWLRGYLLALQQAPNHVKDLVQMQVESENFRFGNNGVVPSLQRWRLPALIGETLVLIWVSMVPVSTLGCLIGRDLLESLGAVLDFCKRTIQCSHIASGILQLRQMVAGHFRLELLPKLPEQWGAPTQSLGRWRKCGQDGVVELWMTRPQWVQYKLQHDPMQFVKCHEHLLTESSLQACLFEPEAAKLLRTAHYFPEFDFGSSVFEACSQANTPWSCQAIETDAEADGFASSPQAHCPKTVARSWHSPGPMGLAKAALALLAFALSQCGQLPSLDFAGRIHDEVEGLACSPFEQRHQDDEPFRSFGVPLAARSSWIPHGVLGGPHSWQHVDDQRPSFEGKEQQSTERQ